MVESSFNGKDDCNDFSIGIELEGTEDSEFEEVVDIEKELAVIAVRNSKGEVNTFPIVEMEFHPTANLVEFLLAPAEVDVLLEEKCKNLAIELVNKLDICGLLAVELFLTKSGEILINEVAPRPHNSGHHTIESCSSSQFEQHIRGILNMPLSDIVQLSPAVMVNLLGADGHTGEAIYPGVHSVEADASRRGTFRVAHI